ncbi:hypothetical protein PDESU_03882 [Pontiella desulfatans]|uniref:FMN-binding domain-containing protein n=1 Tax=Pontiella desulfatans TaxID=2750659 RepID=A0A6C2U5M1_PONDE|nr:hypothetical protein [Pontiella desulfatans]VGO15300.1 hypothetical protein PDESU_03882 [Pontiella desulfatans]
MLSRLLFIGFLFAFSAAAEEVQGVVKAAMAGLEVATSDAPYSRTIKQMYIGWDNAGNPKTGIAYREIDSFKTITGMVVVDKTATGYVLREAVFPDISKIKNAKDRQQVLSILQQFKGVPFDPHAEKSAVDALSSATRYGIKMSGFLNYLARHVALQMENPPDWSKKK